MQCHPHEPSDEPRSIFVTVHEIPCEVEGLACGHHLAYDVLEAGKRRRDDVRQR
ncbi:MAG: hypothetical protein AAGJ10_10145 [Bacteroidota bacterium]